MQMLSTLPLKDRLLRASRSSSPPSLQACPLVTNRPRVYKNWSETNLHAAYQAHLEDGLSVRKAAESFGVPKSTLQDRVSGKVPFGTKSGPSKYLNDEEESELVNFLVGCASVGYAKSKQQVIMLVRSIVESKGIKSALVTDGWWTSFKHRHGQLTVQTAESLSYVRAVSSSPQIISRYYDLLEQTLTDNDLLDKPCQIFKYRRDRYAFRFQST